MENKYSFNLLNVDDTLVSLDSYSEAKGFIVIFSCNHCPYVIGSEARMIALHNKYAPLGYPVIAISSNDVAQYPDDSFDNMKRKSEQKKFPFKYLFDETQEVAKRYGAERTPHVFLLQKENEGDVKLVYSGAIDDNPKFAAEVKEKFLEPVLDSLLAGSPVPYAVKPALGCMVKWKVMG